MKYVSYGAEVLIAVSKCLSDRLHFVINYYFSIRATCIVTCIASVSLIIIIHIALHLFVGPWPLFFFVSFLSYT
jgi:hypothetical protein